MNRRGFLLGLLAAPALVRAASLDYVPRGLILPEPRKLRVIVRYIEPPEFSKEFLDMMDRSYAAVRETTGIPVEWRLA